MINETKGIGYPATSTQSQPQPKRITHFLGIGINDYEHCPKLYNAVKDVQDTIALLEEKYGFDTQYIRTLYDKHATSERILDEFKRLVHEVKPTDNVLIYFSGHGELDNVLDEGFWVPVEAARGKENQYISNSKIEKVLLKINSYHTFLISDSCYSGSLFLDGKGKFVSDAYDFPSRWGLTSGRNTIVSDGKAGTNSPFATAILDTLRHRDEPLNVSALCDIVKQTVPAATKGLQKPIGDPLSIAGHKGGQFIFQPIEKENPEIAAWATALAADTLDDFKQFKEKYPLSKNVEIADKRLVFLQKEADKQAHAALWEKIKQKNRAESYLDFFQNHPTSIYRSEARRLLEIAEDNELWAETPKTRTGMLNYLDTYKNGLHAAQANLFLNPKKPEPPPPPVVKEAPKPKIEVKPRVYTPPTVVDTEHKAPNSKRIWYIGGGIIAVIILAIIMMPQSQPPVGKQPQTEVVTPSVVTPQKPVFDQQKFESLMSDAKGAITAGDKETAVQSLNAAKQMSLNDPRIAEYEQLLKKMK